MWSRLGFPIFYVYDHLAFGQSSTPKPSLVISVLLPLSLNSCIAYEQPCIREIRANGHHCTI
jgi:hypothetical protein